MQLPLALAITVGMFAQTAASAQTPASAQTASTQSPAAAQTPVLSCPADRPVDDFVAELQAKSKKQERTKNPLPDDVCLFGWCSRVKRPYSQRRMPPKASGKVQEGVPTGGAADQSSSKDPDAKCDEAMEVALAAAHDVEVGDFNFEQKNYKGALLRYRAALEQKPDDAAIHVRLGRVYEKVNDLENAIHHYQRAQQLAGPAKWSEEAKAALQRLRPAGM